MLLLLRGHHLRGLRDSFSAIHHTPDAAGECRRRLTPPRLQADAGNLGYPSAVLAQVSRQVGPALGAAVQSLRVTSWVSETDLRKRVLRH
ncbi:hypothetical protein [Saccharopolyspora spinosa]|uniref:hypothetical protein n=1 Tax=Saccharopolyspora spinosa TaxID=60894 RepID=UPI00376EB93D